MGKFYQTSGKNFYIKVLLIHHPTLEEFEKFSIKSEELSNWGQYCYVLSIFGDLKKYVFSFRFKEINNNNIDLKIKKITKLETESIIQETIEGLGLLNPSSKKLKSIENGLVVYDISTAKNEIPAFIKQYLVEVCKDSESIFNVVLIKDPIGSEKEFKATNSIIVNLLAKIKEKVDFATEIRNQQAITVDLKNMLNPFK
jgi:hypothetical protein